MKQDKESTTFGTVSMICGILSLVLFFMPYFNIPLGILAIVFYGMQKKRMPITRGTSGMIMGIIGIVIGAMMSLLVGAALLFSSALGGL